MNNPDADEAAKRKSEIGLEEEEEEEGEIGEYIRNNFEMGQERDAIQFLVSARLEPLRQNLQNAKADLSSAQTHLLQALTHLVQASKCTNKICSCEKTTKRAAMDPPPPDPVVAVAAAARVPHEILESQRRTLRNTYNLRDDNNLYLNKKRRFEFLQSATDREGALFQKLRKAQLDLFMAELNKTDLDLVAAKTAVTVARRDLVRSQMEVARARASLSNPLHYL